MFDDTVRPGLSNVKPMMSGERIIMAVCDKKANTRTSASVYAERTIIAKLAFSLFRTGVWKKVKNFYAKNGLHDILIGLSRNQSGYQNSRF